MVRRSKIKKRSSKCPGKKPHGFPTLLSAALRLTTISYQRTTEPKLSAMVRFFQARLAYPAELQSHGNINVNIKNFTLDVYSLKKKKKSQQAENMFQKNKGVNQGTSLVMLINFYLSPSPSRECSSMVRLAWVSVSG